MRLEFIGALLLLATALFCAGSGGTISPPLAGLAISSAMSLGGLLTVGVASVLASKVFHISPPSLPRRLLRGSYRCS